MSEKTKSELSSDDIIRKGARSQGGPKLHLTKRGETVRNVLVGTGVGGTILAGAIAAPHVVEGIRDFNEAHDLKPVANEVLSIGQGENIINSVTDRVEIIISENGDDPEVKIPTQQIIEESQNAGTLNSELTGEQVMPGDEFLLTVLKNDVGTYSVEVTPLQEAEKPEQE